MESGIGTKAGITAHLDRHDNRQMTTRKITTMALIAGIVLGAAATEGFNFYRQSHDSHVFQERLRCKAVADAYVKEENSTDPWHGSWILDKVDYSPARNSCVADVKAHYFFRTPPFTNEDVQDLLSGENLFSAQCTEKCAVTEVTFVIPAFDYVINNASKPSELQKAWMDFMASKSPPQSPPPSGH